MNFPSASDSLNITSTHALQTPEKISNHTNYGRKGGKHCRTEMCAQKEWHGEFSTDLSGETSWPPVCIPAGHPLGCGFWFSHSLLCLTAVLCLEGWKASRDLQRLWELKKRRKIGNLTHIAQKNIILRNVQECFISCHRKIQSTHWWN